MLQRFFLIGSCLLVLSCGDDDGGGDSSMEDGAMVCSSNDDCDDEVFCNGQETCNPMSDDADGMGCVAGEAPCADDESCMEEGAQCLTFCDVNGDRDGDGERTSECGGNDCDDNDATRFPGNQEICDGIDRDEDCNDATFGNRDNDGDGFFSAECCNGSNCGDDCDDTRRSVNLGAVEVCDGLDNDCDSNIDEGVLVDGLADGDRDGFGDVDQPMRACPGTVGFVPTEVGDPVDCDDADPTRNPGQVEICDMMDNDCDDEMDENAVPVPWYADRDGDGFGTDDRSNPDDDIVESCDPVDGFSLLGTDCDDENASISPSAAEMCDAVDNDCSGRADFQLDANNWEDDDQDGLVDVACGAPRGIDCDDNDPATGPGTAEVCDGRDNDCDEEIDEGVMNQTWFRDTDGDGFGSAVGGSFVGCSAPPGFVTAGGDCNDNDPNVAPMGTEVCNARDDDCDGSTDESSDPGGVCGCPSGLADCNSDGFCETNTATDPDNCGGCGTTCGGVNVEFAVCVGGQCLETDCADGYQDCDSGVAGCETQTINDINNCGGCGRQCSMNGASSTSCNDYRCEPVCEANSDDCDGDGSNGCEAPTDSDPFNCGGCGRGCSAVNASSAICEGGNCSLTCLGGYGDCNTDGIDGCETPINTPDRCGSCSLRCGRANTFDVRCEQVVPDTYACQLDCQPGYADCDGDGSNGCETLLDPMACGCPPGPTQNCLSLFPGHNVQCEFDSFMGGAFCRDLGCGNPSDFDCGGTCTDITSDPNNCGGCGFVCDGRGTTATACVGSTCQPTCMAGYDDCDFDGRNGCEADINADPRHCGSCTTDCEAMVGPSAIAGCAGNCQIVGCTDPALGDCDGALANGCEANLDLGEPFGMVINNCGGCSAADPMRYTCDNTNANSVSCTFGDCDLQCFSGFGDCDHLPGNGCEQSLTNDPTNCGQCGKSCGAGGFCGAGLCDLPVSTAVGLGHSCAVRSSGAVVCWGANDSEQLGIPGPAGSNVPVHTQSTGPDMINAVEVVVGNFHSCLLDNGGNVYCWGSNAVGQLGQVGTGTFDVPQPVSGIPGQAVAIAAGRDHTCVVTIDGGVYCWGDNTLGQLGNETIGGNFSTPQQAMGIDSAVITAAPYIAAGEYFTCVKSAFFTSSSDQVICWGQGDSGQLGDGNGTTRGHGEPIVVANGAFDLVSLRAGANHACALMNFNMGEPQLHCWGDDAQFQLQDASGGNPSVLSPVPMAAPAATAKDIALGRNHTCALRMDGRVFCWGTGLILPGGDSTPIANPQRIVELGNSTYRMPASGPVANHVCIITQGDDVYCWGINSQGQLGNPSTPMSLDQPPNIVVGLGS